MLGTKTYNLAEMSIVLKTGVIEGTPLDICNIC